MPIAASVVLRQTRCLTELGRLCFLHSSSAAAAKAAFKRKAMEPRPRYRNNGPKQQQQQQQSSSSSSHGPQRSRRGGHGGPPPKQKRPQAPQHPVIDGPLLNEQHYLDLLAANAVTLPRPWVSNPKDQVKTYATSIGSRNVNYQVHQVMFSGSLYWRATVRLGDTAYHGDALTRKEAERISALSAVIDLARAGLIEVQKPPKDKVDIVQLPDGTTLDYELCKQFMEYYCRRFGFDMPLIQYEVHKVRSGNPPWDALLAVGGKRIGVGTGVTKKIAMQNAYVDVTQYLHNCDPELWKAFREAMRTGKDLGLAPRVGLSMSDSLGDSIRELNRFLRGSALYRNRPSSATADDGKTAPAPAPRYSRARNDERFHEDKSARLLQGREAYAVDPVLEKIRAQRQSLPVYTQASELLRSIEENEVTICMAATGSGKTTQIPQIILDDWIAKGQGSRCNILCTQPRRLAAISVADRVAKERGEPTGKSIGYQVRFEANLPEMHGCVTFCTTGIFLRRMQSALEAQDLNRGASLDDVTHVIVDEAHERDVDTDLTLMVLKRLLADRRARGIPIKVVLMSATIDPTIFQNYFSTEVGEPAPLVSIPGRSFPVQKHFLDSFLPDLRNAAQNTPWVFREDTVVKYLNREIGVGQWGQPPPMVRAGSSYSSLPGSPRMNPENPEENARRDDDLEIPFPLVALTIAHVLRKSNDGHVLVFLPGWEEIQSVQRILSDPMKPLLDISFLDRTKYQILILHSSIPVAEQQQVFEPPSPGVRRIILSTNIAETSVTIPDVVYVVDAARVKELRFEPERHISSLVSAWVGASNLNQRAGRAGRHRPGEYYGVLSQAHADRLSPYQTVEMLRTDLSNVVMHVKALNFPNLDVEDVLAATIEPPDPERVEAALEHLRMVGALDKDKNLTSLGHVLLQLPIEAVMGRLILFGAFFRCLDRALTLAAIMTNRDPFMTPILQKKEAQARKDSWTPNDFRSDPLAVLRAYETWWGYQSRGEYSTANQFCFDNFLSKPTLTMIQKIKGHLLQNLYTAGVIDVAIGRVDPAAPMPAGLRRSDQFVPQELNENNNSRPLLAALIAVASQPKFAVRTGERTLRTQREKATFIHPSSVNHVTRESREMTDESTYLKDIYAFAEKRQNLTTGEARPQMYLMSTTKLDPLTYVLFGAYDVQSADGMLECDEWVPISGYVPTLQEIGKMKYLMESCLLRIYEGIFEARRKRQQRVHRYEPNEREEEWEDDKDAKAGPLSAPELTELSKLGRDLVNILDSYNAERGAGSASRRNSRPATPSDASFGRLQLPSGTRSGYATPRSRLSRPSTPSSLRF
ncbi:P-loop containing nucleoside triphosphate hydrolase protein [Auricularia subglabra TFB-10046 SS5]|nr:P-loop containing nucleoside triphosphate hydrolase protein [Auricularia subglabra TFB-10046 SS5]